MELYRADLTSGGTFSKLQPVNGEGTMLRGFAARQ
jgi:hypothetical protein